MSRLAYVAGGSLPLRDLAHLANACEEAGYESFWVTEGNTKDAFANLAALGARTHSIALGSGVALIYSRTPTMVAMSAAAVDEAADGRLLLGLGVGRGRIPGSGLEGSIEGMYGVRFEKPVDGVRDYVNIVRQILRGERASYRGEAYSLDGFRLSFKPVRPEIPIYMAGQGPRMVTLAGEVADGILFSNVSPEYVRSVMPLLRQGAEKAGRDPSRIDVGCFMFAAPEWSREATETAWRAMAQRCAMTHYEKMFEQVGFAEEARAVAQAVNAGDMERAVGLTPRELVGSLSLVGDPEAWRDRLAQYREAGVLFPVIRPATSVPDSLRLIEETADIFQE